MKRTPTFLTLLACLALSAVMLVGGAACSSSRPEEPAEQESAAEPVVEDAAAVPVVEEQADPAALQREHRSELATAFATTWHSSIVVDPNDALSWSNSETWYDDCVAFVAPGSTLYEQFEAAARGEFYGPGVNEVSSVTKSAEVIGIEGDTYTVRYVYAVANSYVSNWQDQTTEGIDSYTFNGDDKIVHIHTEYADWG